MATYLLGNLSAASHLPYLLPWYHTIIWCIWVTFRKESSFTFLMSAEICQSDHMSIQWFHPLESQSIITHAGTNTCNIPTHCESRSLGGLESSNCCLGHYSQPGWVVLWCSPAQWSTAYRSFCRSGKHHLKSKKVMVCTAVDTHATNNELKWTFCARCTWLFFWRKIISGEIKN